MPGYEKAYLMAGQWEEEWTYTGCERTAAVTVKFVADGFGGAHMRSEQSGRIYRHFRSRRGESTQGISAAGGARYLISGSSGTEFVGAGACQPLERTISVVTISAPASRMREIAAARLAGVRDDVASSTRQTA